MTVSGLAGSWLQGLGGPRNISLRCQRAAGTSRRARSPRHRAHSGRGAGPQDRPRHRRRIGRPVVVRAWDPSSRTAWAQRVAASQTEVHRRTARTNEISVALATLRFLCAPNRRAGQRAERLAPTRSRAPRRTVRSGRSKVCRASRDRVQTAAARQADVVERAPQQAHGGAR